MKRSTDGINEPIEILLNNLNEKIHNRTYFLINSKGEKICEVALFFIINNNHGLESFEKRIKKLKKSCSFLCDKFDEEIKILQNRLFTMKCIFFNLLKIIIAKKKKFD